MPASIEQLKGALTAGFGPAKQNLFQLQMPVLSQVGGTVDSQTFNILCKSVTMPGVQVMTKDRTVNSFFEKVAYQNAYSEVTATFIETNSFGVRNYFTDWINFIFNQEDGTVQYKKDYVCDMRIFPLDKNDEVRYAIQLINAFPTTMTSVDFSNDAEGIVETTISLSYQRWIKL